MIRLYLRKYVDLGPDWMRKEEWEDAFKGHEDVLVDFLNEDLSSFWEDVGGLAHVRLRPSGGT